MYQIVFSLCWLISLLPLRVLYFFSDFMYLLVRYVVRYRRKVVRKNLSESFPEKSEMELREIERKFYHAFCDYFAEDIKSISMSKKQMMKRMTFGNAEWLKEGFEKGDYQLMFLFLGHLGNWEWIASIKYWFPEFHISQVYHKLYNDVSERLFLYLRERYGGECIPMQNTFRRLYQLKKEGKKVYCGFIADQQPKWEAIHHFTPFLNHETAVFIGGEHIAKRLGAVMAYGRMSRVRRGYYHLDFIPISTDSKSVPDYEATDQYMHMLEEDIRNNPHLWLWSHKRWSRTKEEWERRQAANGNGA